jgi:acetyl esterase/lipase
MFRSALLCAAIASASAAELVHEAQLRLWDGPAPLAKGKTDQDIPMVQVFLPKAGTASGAAMVIFPGGGYGHLAKHEGSTVGQWMAERGVIGFVVRYRLGPTYQHPAMMTDGQRAVQFVRAHAAEWKIDPKRIGVIGFSAGGHLASTVSTHIAQGEAQAADPIARVSSRPDLSVLVYPVVTMGKGTHGGSKNNLLGANPDAALVDLMSNEKQVTKDTPPTFLVHSTTDKVVPVSNSDNYVEALKAAGVTFEYMRGQLGNHGIGLKNNWTPQFEAWLVKQGFIRK